MLAVVSFSSKRGGAAKAARKFFAGMAELSHDIKFVVVENLEADVCVASPGWLGRTTHFAKHLVSYALTKLQYDGNPTKHSLNLFSCRYVLKELAGCEVVHLNWFNNDTISVPDLATIEANLIITLHDEWFYCGAEHYAKLGDDRPFIGYQRKNGNVRGIDWNRHVWNWKSRALASLRHRVIFTVPSRWMLERARASALLRNADIRLLPNLIDTVQFNYCGLGALSRFLDGVPNGSRVLLFGAVGGGSNPLKGFNVLQESIRLVGVQDGLRDSVVLMTFGGERQGTSSLWGFRHIEIGVVSNIQSLAQLYSIATLTIVPSLVESFGQVAAESLACETPVVAFRCSGLTDIVTHGESGYLADPYDPESLCAGITWLLSLDDARRREMGRRGRQHVISHFSKPVVMAKLASIYAELEAKVD